jgi:geranylgeranyl diphosphate synthase type I
LTQGQHLDIAFESQDKVEIEKYWQMVGGKTAALLAFSLEVGALCAAVSPEIQSNFHDFGHYLGLAFQVQDDILGIWGDEEIIGKSSTGDLVVRKKTLPILFGLGQKNAFFEAWMAGPITPEAAVGLGQVLEAEGGRAYAQSTADRLTDLALTALEGAQPQGNAGEILRELAKKLLNRKQ